MEKLLIIYPPQPDAEAFKSYYEATHFPLVKTMPGLRRASYSFEVAVLAGEWDRFCIFEAEFDDRDALFAALQSTEGQKVAADTPNFAQVPATILHYRMTE